MGQEFTNGREFSCVAATDAVIDSGDECGPCIIHLQSLRHAEKVIVRFNHQFVIGIANRIEVADDSLIVGGELNLDILHGRLINGIYNAGDKLYASTTTTSAGGTVFGRPDGVSIMVGARLIELSFVQHPADLRTVVLLHRRKYSR